MPVELGSGMRQTRRSRDELVVQSDLEGEVTAQLVPEIRRLEALVRSLTADKNPVINVAPGVAPVSVTTPEVTVLAADMPDITIPGIEQLHTELRGLRSDINKLANVLVRPVTKTVERDGNGYITTIVETR